MIDLDPLAADQGQPVGMRQQPLDLGRRELFAVERHLHPEVEQRIQPELRRRIAADRCLHLRARRAVHAPARRHPHDHAGAFERGNVLQELQRLLRAPAQRMKDLARIDHGLQPGAMLGGALDGHQQRQQALAVPRTGIFLQSLAERQMLGLGLSRKPRRVGRKKRERGVLVLPVLGEIEMHAPDQVPGRMTALEELLHGELGLRQLGIEGRIHASPKIGQDGRRQVFRADHGRNGRGHLVQLAVRGNRHRRLGTAVADTGKGAQCGHVARSELPPVRQHWRQSRPDFVCAQPQQSVPGAPYKCLLQPQALLGLQRQRFLRLPEGQQTMRSENGCQVIMTMRPYDLMGLRGGSCGLMGLG